MAVPVPRTYVASEFETAAILNGDIRDTFNFILAPPRAFAYRTLDLSTTSGTDTVYDMTAELYDPYATPAHDNATNNSRMIAAETGIYTVLCQVTWASNATGRRQIQVRKNAAGASGGGTQVAIQNTPASPGGFATRLNIAVDVPMTATDYLEMFFLQDSTVALNVVGGQSSTFMSIRFVAKQ